MTHTEESLMQLAWELALSEGAMERSEHPLRLKDHQDQQETALRLAIREVLDELRLSRLAASDNKAWFDSMKERDEKAEADKESTLKQAVRNALERVTNKTVVYELHNGMIVKAVPRRDIDALLKEYK